jgi:hypothetical protein
MAGTSQGLINTGQGHRQGNPMHWHTKDNGMGGEEGNLEKNQQGN